MNNFQKSSKLRGIIVAGSLWQHIPVLGQVRKACNTPSVLPRLLILGFVVSEGGWRSSGVGVEM